MAVKDADPNAQELTAAFTDAMNAPAKPREAATPPEIDPDAPHGRDDQGQALAPYGLTKDGKPKRTPAGRKPKDATPRVTSEPPAAEPKPVKGTVTALPLQDFSGPLSELHDAIWLGLSGFSMIGPKIPVIGRKLGDGSKIAAEAYIWQSNKPQLIKAAQLAADHNAAARARLAKLATGETTWLFMCAFTVMPFFAQTAAVLSGDDALRQMNPDATVEVLAGLNRQKWGETMENMKAQAMAAALQAEDEAMTGQPETNGHAPEFVTA